MNMLETPTIKEARAERRRRKREVAAFLSDSLFKENAEAYERTGTSGQLDEAAVFTYDGPISWRVRLALRADGTMPMQIIMRATGDKPERIYAEVRDGDVYWLESTLP